MECPGLFCLTGPGPEDQSEKGWIPVFLADFVSRHSDRRCDSRETAHVRGDRRARDYVPDFKEDMAG
jgi:hypothetical protein